MCHHKGDETCACAYVENTAAAVSQRAEQYSVCAYFHGAEVMVHGELLESEIFVPHNLQ